MDERFSEIQKLLRDRADLQARLNILPYSGTPEIKTVNEKKYLYIRRRVASRVTSEYVDVYSDELYDSLLRYNREARELRKNIRRIDRELTALGFSGTELSVSVRRNIDFARANLKKNIYDQAVLEGVATSFPQTEEIIDGGIVNGMTAADIQKILNLKHAWEFILDEDVVASASGYYILCHIAKIVNEGFFEDGGRIRGVPVTIGGSVYKPPLPTETDVIDKINAIITSDRDDIEKAVRLCIFCMKTQIFLDGNKRASVIFANHFLVSHGAGLLVIPEENVSEFKRLLVGYYEGADENIIISYLRENCVTELKQ